MSYRNCRRPKKHADNNGKRDPENQLWNYANQDELWKPADVRRKPRRRPVIVRSPVTSNRKKHDNGDRNASGVSICQQRVEKGRPNPTLEQCTNYRGDADSSLRSG